MHGTILKQIEKKIEFCFPSIPLHTFVKYICKRVHLLCFKVWLGSGYPSDGERQIDNEMQLQLVVAELSFSLMLKQNSICDIRNGN